LDLKTNDNKKLGLKLKEKKIAAKEEKKNRACFRQ